MHAATATVAGHFGELLQGRLGPDGPLVLVTLPAPPLVVRAELAPGPFQLHCPGERPIERRAVAALWRGLGGVPRGRLVVRSCMPAGGGAGSSTAALVAVARAAHAALERAAPEPEALAALCLGIEGASDPLMFVAPGRRLWAPRMARTVASLPQLPPLEVVGGFFGPGVRTDPADLAFADVGDLVAAFAPAAVRGDLATLGQLASASAERNHSRRGGAALAPLFAAARRHGALGVVAAHTGSARGLLFAPGAGDAAGAVAALRAAGLRGLVRYRTGREGV